MEKKISKKTLSKSFHHWYYGNLTCFSQEHMQTFGYLTSMLPIIEELYDKKEDQAKALKTYTAFFNTEPQLGTVIVGVTAGLEEARANGAEDVDDETINGLRAGLMGPIAGIGDSLFWGVWRVVCAGLAIGFANAGKILAPIIFLVLFNVPNFLCRYYGACLGYSLGAKYIEKLYANGMIEILTKAAGIVGLIMVGAMTSNTVIFKTVLEFKMKGQSLMNVQSALDSIFKGIVPLLMTFGCYKLLNKKVNVIAIIFGIVALGIVLSLLGIC